MKKLWLAILLGLCMTTWGYAASIYVDTTLADCASTYNPATRLCSGGSVASWSTLAEAISAASCGDTIFLRSGTSTEVGIMDFKNCTSSSVLTIKSYQNETFTHTPSAPTPAVSGADAWRMYNTDFLLVDGAGTDGGRHIILDAAVAVNNGIRLTSDTTIAAKDITLKNIEVKNSKANCIGMQSALVARITIEGSLLHDCGDTVSQDHGIYWKGSGHILRRNEIFNIVGFGIHAFDNTTAGNDTVIEYNYIHDVFSWCINSYRSNRAIIRFNVCYLNGDVVNVGGIRVYGSSTDAVIYANTIAGNDGPCIQIDSGATRTVAKNNWCIANINNTITNAGTGTVTANNTFTSTSGAALVKSYPSDFSPLASSPALAAGTTSIVTAGTSPTGNTHTASLTQSCIGTCPTGAHDSPIFGSCSVEDGDATKIRVLLTTSSVIQGSTAANWAAVVAGSGVSESAPTVVGTSRMDITVPAVTGGQSVTIAYTAPASSPLRDSLNIGNTRSSAVRSFTAQSCINRVAAPSNATLEQNHFGWYELYALEESGGSLVYRACGQDAPCTFGAYGRVALRLKMRCNTANCDPTTVALRYSLMGGAYTELPNTAGADKIAYFPCPNIPPLTNTTERLTSGSGGYVAGKVIDTQVALPNVDLAQNDEVEYLYCLGWVGATVTDTYDFRFFDQDCNPITAYTVTPRATIGYSGRLIKAR